MLKMCVIFAVLFFIVGCECADSSACMARRRALLPPRIIQKTTDGCDIYQFHSEDEKVHYFTRCSDKTLTTRNYIQSQGKTLVQQEEEIETLKK